MTEQLKAGIEKLDALLSGSGKNKSLFAFVADTGASKTMFWRDAIEKAREEGAIIPYVDAEASLRESEMNALLGRKPPDDTP